MTSVGSFGSSLQHDDLNTNDRLSGETAKLWTPTATLAIEIGVPLSRFCIESDCTPLRLDVSDTPVLKLENGLGEIASSTRRPSALPGLE